MGERMLTVELWQENHDRLCAQRWGYLIKLIGWGGGVALTSILAVAAWGLDRVYNAQQQQVAAIERLVAQHH